MKFKIDENLSGDVASILRAAGHDAMTVGEQRMRGASDPDLYEVCRRERRVLITLDVGFADITAYPPKDSAGTVVLRLHSQSRRVACDVARRLCNAFAHREIAGSLWVVDETSIRERREGPA